MYVLNHGNLGLSRAFNKVLRDRSFSWEEDEYIVFFDQDSRVESRHMLKLVCAYEEVEQAGYHISCIGPAYRNPSDGKMEIAKGRQIRKGFYEVSAVITSSMLTKYKNIREAGFFDPHVFLDMADWALCWKMRAKGGICVATSKVWFWHSVGEENLYLGPVRVRVWKPFREYYQIRDASYLLRKSYVPSIAKRKLFAMCTVMPLARLVLLPDRKERLHYMIKGCTDFKRK